MVHDNTEYVNLAFLKMTSDRVGLGSVLTSGKSKKKTPKQTRI